MRKTVVILIIILLSNKLFSQTQKHNYFIGGTISGNYLDEYPNAFWFILQPTFGYFLANNFALGVMAPSNFSFSKTSTSVSYGATPFIRKYFKTNSNFKPFIGLALGYNQYNSKDIYTSINSSGNQYNYGFGIGCNYFFNKSASIITTINYEQYNNFKSAQTFIKSNGYVTLNIGVEIYFIRTNKEKNTSH